MSKAFVLPAALLAIFLVFLSTATVAAAGGSNGTRIADTLMDGEEFLMESETARRILGQRRVLKYKPLNQGPACNGEVYGSCNGKGKINPKRKCDYQNKCGRGSP